MIVTRIAIIFFTATAVLTSCKRMSGGDAQLKDNESGNVASGNDGAARADVDAVFHAYFGRGATLKERHSFAGTTRTDVISKVTAAIAGASSDLGTEYHEVFSQRVNGFLDGSLRIILDIGAKSQGRTPLALADGPGPTLDDKAALDSLLDKAVKSRNHGLPCEAKTGASVCFSEWLGQWLGSERKPDGRSYSELIRNLAQAE